MENGIKRSSVFPHILSACMLFVALTHWPYAYYQILRWVVCGSAGYAAYFAYKSRKNWIMWVMIPVAILFNPLAPIYLHRTSWIPIDILVGCWFMFAAIIQRRK